MERVGTELGKSSGVGYEVTEVENGVIYNGKFYSKKEKNVYVDDGIIHRGKFYSNEELQAEEEEELRRQREEDKKEFQKEKERGEHRGWGDFKKEEKFNLLGDEDEEVLMFYTKAEPIIINVYIASQYENTVEIVDKSVIADLEEYEPYIRFSFVTDIYRNRLFLEFLRNLDMKKKGHTYEGKLTFETFQMFSQALMDGKYAEDKNFYDSALMSIVIFTNHEDYQDMFDSILTSDIEYKDPITKHFEPYTNDQLINILTRYKLYEHKPYELSYTHFENNIDIPADSNCVLNVITNTYGTYQGCRDKKKISTNNIKKYFKDDTSVARLLTFCSDYKIPFTMLDVFGNIIISKNPDCKENSKRTGLVFIAFGNHIYPYQKSVRKISNIDLEYTNGDVLYDSKALYGEDTTPEDVKSAKKEFCIEFTSNMSFKSEHQVCPKSLRYSVKTNNKLIGFSPSDLKCKEKIHSYEGDHGETITYSEFIYSVEDKKCYEDVEYLITEIDMKKAFHTAMFDLMKSSVDIPVFSVKSIIKKYEKESIHDSNIYYLKKDSLSKLKEYGLYSNYHHGFVINYLLDEGIIKKSDIEAYKPYCSLYRLSEYRERVENIIKKYNLDGSDEDKEKYKSRLARTMINLLYEGKPWKELTDREKKEKNMKLHKLRKEHCSVKTFTDIFMLYNGICGMSYTNPKRKYIRLRKEDLKGELEFLSIKNKDIDVSEVYEYDDYVQISKATPKKYKYLNNRNIYDYCISATNLYMLKAINSFKELNPLLKVVRINTDCITFVMKPTHKVTLNGYLNKYFKFKYVTQETAEKTTCSENYIDSNKVLDGMSQELNKMKENTTGYIGGPGTGKTYNVKKENKHDFAITISNVCCRNMDTERVKADTMYSYFIKGSDKKRISLNERLRRFYNKTIWFDEFSMFDTEYFNYIFLLTQLKNAKIIITGDPNQIPPFHSESVNLKHPFFEMLFSNTKLLDKNMRVSDNDDGEELFSYIEKVRNNLENDKFVEDIKKMQIEYDQIANTNVHLTYNVKTKDMINNFIFDKNNHKFELMDGGVYLTKGLRLIVRSASKKFELYKSIIYEVINTGIYRESVKLWNVTLRKEEVHKVKFLHNMGLGFAITTHSSQGLTIREKCCIHQSDKMFDLDPRIYYTAVTRATKMSDIIHVKGNFEYEDDKIRILS